ncbi:MAG: aspartate/glutamate racemase family protein [Candidatus Bathyarchaeia archaeon]
MKLIGLIGGTGWVSTIEYYRIMNEEVNRRLGGLQSAKCVLYSFNYAVIHELNESYDAERQGALMVDAAKKLVSIGAEGIVLCANTLHQFAERVEKEIPVPLIHVSVATAMQIKKQNFRTVGLLATKYTMEMDFYKRKLNEANIQVLIPDAEEREFIHHTITHELLKGVLKEESKARFLEIMNHLHSRGAQGIILGCTEIPLLVKQHDTELPLFDTLSIHALAAVDFALENDSRTGQDKP